MFHVLLALPVLAAFGAAAGAVLAAVLGLLGLAFFAELLLGLFCRKLRWLMWLPVLMGALGLLLSLMAFLPVSLGAVLLFWGGYGLMLLLGLGVSRLLRRLFSLLAGV